MPTWIVDEGAPSDDVGSNGDMYLRSDTGSVYGPKTAGAWGDAVADITGDTGPAGAAGVALAWAGAWASATEYTINQGVSNDGSSYICTSEHTSGASTEPGVGASWQTVWDTVAEKGDTGETGAAGSNGAAGADGADGADGDDGRSVLNGAGAPAGGTGLDGDFYIDTDVWDIYGPKTAGAWGTGTTLVGPQGDAGANGSNGADGVDGTDGVDGSVWYAGSADPTTEGQDGDFYLQTGTGSTGELGDVWQKAGGTWTITGNIRGASGAGTGDMNDVVDDMSPQLGGDLDTNGFHILISNGEAIRTGTTAGNTALIQARNTNGAGSWTTFLTLTAGDPPTADLSTSVTRGGNTILDAAALGVTAQAYSAKLAAIAALAVTDGGFIVGDGATFVLETGATVRTSLGLGTGDSPQFTGINLGHASDTTLTRVSAGRIAVEGVNLDPNIPQNSKSAAYTLVLGDANTHILHPSADTTARIFTIPANSSVAFPIGTWVTFVNQNAGGVITIAITTDTMRLAGAGTTGSRTLAANGIATALKITSTEWIISGTGLT
jgi:hypothetical protein